MNPASTDPYRTVRTWNISMMPWEYPWIVSSFYVVSSDCDRTGNVICIGSLELCMRTIWLAHLSQLSVICASVLEMLTWEWHWHWSADPTSRFTSFWLWLHGNPEVITSWLQCVQMHAQWVVSFVPHLMSWYPNIFPWKNINCAWPVFFVSSRVYLHLYKVILFTDHRMHIFIKNVFQ